MPGQRFVRWASILIRFFTYDSPNRGGFLLVSGRVVLHFSAIGTFTPVFFANSFASS
jgi:hypothetical protein